MEIWLADLTYDQQSLASDVVPAAIGGLAELIEVETNFSTRLFKQPQDLLDALAISQPEILGFSNYVWNAQISLKIAEIAKNCYPEIIIITGGPNISSHEDEIRSYLLNNASVDFAILKEGETGVVNLLKLLESKTSIQVISEKVAINGVAFLDEKNELVKGDLERFLNLELLPSPYLSGKLDKWLDGKWLPVIQTNRGCPFTCTFCTEGQSYWSKVRKKPLDVIRLELDYIAKKIVQNDSHRSDLLITDSNFGMYDQDIQVAIEIAHIQEKYDYPTYINVATGKNKKEKVLEVAKIVKGAMKLAGSVQSLDEKVLINIKRDNIKPESLMDMALEAAKIGTNTYSEVILGLPGDSVEAHLSTLQKLIDAGFTTIAAYQMMLLPATEMNLPETREKYGFVTRFRLLPRCYGYYHFKDTEFCVAEIEEIVVAHNSLSIEDYLFCRRFNLITTIFYNDGIFLEFHRLLKVLNISSYEWLKSISEKSKNSKINDFLLKFENDTLTELWESREELSSLVTSRSFIENAINGQIGNNVLFFYKALSLTIQIDEIFEVALDSFQEILSLNRTGKNDLNIPSLAITDLFNYRKAQIEGSLSGQRTSTFIPGFFASPTMISSLLLKLEVADVVEPNDFTKGVTEGKLWELNLTVKQVAEISSYLDVFGRSEIGLSRVLSRVFLRHYFKQLSPDNSVAESFSIPSAQFGIREV